MSKTVHLQHYTAERPLPVLSTVRSVLAIMALLAATLALFPNEAPGSPYSLFLRLEADALAEGGADVPGQVTGRPQVRRPTSLVAADQPVVLVDYTSQTPVILERDGTRPGAWHSRLLSVQYVMPLRKAPPASPWTVGIQLGKADKDITYDLLDESYSISADSDSHTLSLDRQRRRGTRACGC